MKRETLEKIRNILEHLFELFIFILIMLITFGSLHVHAAGTWTLSSNVGNHTLVVSHYYKDLFQQSTYSIPLDDSNYFYAVSFTGKKNINGWDQLALYAYRIDGSGSPIRYSFSDTRISVSNHNEQKDGSFIDSEGGFVSSIEMWFVPEDYSSSSERGYSYVTSLPFFESVDAMKNYCLTGDTSGLLNGGGSIDNPNFEDTAYAFTGFTANNKMTATWTGTTERSYLKDQEVEEYVRVNYYFADKEAQDTIKQTDAYPDEFATADKTLTIDVSGLKPDNENWFLRYIRITPCYRQAGLGAWGDFYHGSDVYVYFDLKGNIEKVIQKSKPTDLNKGNMIYDSSIGYLQNVIYTEEKSHDGSGRQATFKWSTNKSLPSDAQVEIVAQNFYIEWFNKKTEENFIFKEYGEDCYYSTGSYSFNANTPVWTWLKEKEIDPFSFKTQGYGSTEYYLRIVTYNVSDSLYHYGGWVKVNIKSKDTINLPTTDVETGGFDVSSGLWNQDTESDDSYHYSTDDKGKLTGNIDVNSWEDLNMNSFTWMYRNMQSMVSSLGEFPTMVNAVFGYLPVQLITAIGVLLVAIVLLRFLGR